MVSRALEAGSESALKGEFIPTRRKKVPFFLPLIAESYCNSTVSCLLVLATKGPHTKLVVTISCNHPWPLLFHCTIAKTSSTFSSSLPNQVKGFLLQYQLIRSTGRKALIGPEATYSSMANNAIAYSSVKSPQHPNLSSISQGIESCKQKNAHFSSFKLNLSGKRFWHAHGKIRNFMSSSRGSSSSRRSTETQNTETRECSRKFIDRSDTCSGTQVEDEHPVGPVKIVTSNLGLSEACKYVCNDAKYVNERARNDIVLLSQGIMRLDARARRDVAILGSEFLKLDARAREDTEKIDNDVKRKAERLHHVATILKNKAQSRLKRAADRHWSDGALEADLRRADVAAKQRAMEDALMALEFVKNIHDRMVNKYKFPLNKNTGFLNTNDLKEQITLEKNGKTLNFLPGEVSADRIAAIKEAYLSIAAALSEADGIDYTDPEELELLVATLIDLDAMDGKRSASLLAECSSSPDENTRKALANALSAAPSMWTLGNAGMGALQRLAEDSNPAIAAAASRTIQELKRQWEIKDGDSWRFMVNQIPTEDEYSEDDED